ncbi:methylenetetrahydrofolate reductase [Gulosibacter chungangensis]|uniref:Methylenetetrahydrofolate reductase n=1 Tax=Gulosibacter chungangensis TaxID=979746 RepID=A0A7J5B848_9MICO|nr:methylenetetrahydrofolate reductase [Gulosibacter chungangensis]KAB1641231.1 methylenetetrahydrofolate reductase [Gulosibacter chungangensis]
MIATQNPVVLLRDYSIEMTARDIDEVPEAASHLPAKTRVNVTFLATESLEQRVAGAKAVLDAGLTPVPHIAARRLKGQSELRKSLRVLQDAGASKQLFVVGGDPAVPEGPYASSFEVIESGILPEYGVEHVGIGGYPEGHPDISQDVLWEELEKKTRALAAQGLEANILTQFGFDEAPILDWIAEVRKRGITAKIRIGVPGPAGVKRLLGFARRFGISSSAGIVKKYGFSLTNLMGTAGPDRLLETLAEHLDPEVHGDVGIHFYTFGGVAATSKWAEDYLAN